MQHKPIHIKSLSLSFSHKLCFDGFNVQINCGNRIAIIGRNGSGKTTLLKILNGIERPTSGEVQCHNDVVYGFVPQIIEDLDCLSGGQRLNESFTRALSLEPNVLLLDEPTNHLDSYNRKSLMRMPQSYSGTLIIVSHDVELLRDCVDTFWHLDNGKVHIFNGNYDDYVREMKKSRAEIECALLQLTKQKKMMHYDLMREQDRSSKSKKKGEKSVSQKKWPTMVSHAKAGKAEETTARKRQSIDTKKHALEEKLSMLYIPEVIVPKFALTNKKTSDSTIVSLSDASIGYSGQNPLLQKISLSLMTTDRIAIQGSNASGKSSLIKALLDDRSVLKTGGWLKPKRIDIGYLDQHYSTLSNDVTAFEMISNLMPDWSALDVRRHLNDFLFRKNEEVGIKIQCLSGGEKARLTLAQIAAKPPKLLILDEVTNNLDIETRNHVIEVLKYYSGAMIVISHDEGFLNEIDIVDKYHIENGHLSRKE